MPVEIFNALVRHVPKVKTSQAYRFAFHYLLIDRDFVDHGLHDLVRHAIFDFEETERYNLISMTRWNYANAKKNRDYLIAEALTQVWPYEPQARVASYLHRLPFGLFAKQILYRI